MWQAMAPSSFGTLLCMLRMHERMRARTQEIKAVGTKKKHNNTKKKEHVVCLLYCRMEVRGGATMYAMTHCMRPLPSWSGSHACAKTHAPPRASHCVGGSACDTLAWLGNAVRVAAPSGASGATSDSVNAHKVTSTVYLENRVMNMLEHRRTCEPRGKHRSAMSDAVPAGAVGAMGATSLYLYPMPRLPVTTKHQSRTSGVVRKHNGRAPDPNGASGHRVGGNESDSTIVRLARSAAGADTVIRWPGAIPFFARYIIGLTNIGISLGITLVVA